MGIRNYKIIVACKTIILICTLLCIHSASAHAANFYVRKGASGDGKSWAAAWNDINNISGIGSGDTIYIAAGNYTGRYTANSNGWTLKRATAASNSGDPGWSSTYEGTVNINNTEFTPTFLLTGRNNITINGVDKTYFKIYGSGANRPSYGIANGNPYTSNADNSSGYNITVQNVTIYGMKSAGIMFYNTSGGCKVLNCTLYNNGWNNSEELDAGGVNMRSTAVHGANEIAYNYIHNPGYQNPSGLTIDSITTCGSDTVYIHDNTFEPGWEDENSADLISIRAASKIYIYNNLFSLGANANQNIFISASNGSVSNIYIYNNLFYKSSTVGGTPGVAADYFGGSGYPYTLNGLYVYNNTFIGYTSCIMFYGSGNPSYYSNIKIKNNIFNSTSSEIYDAQGIATLPTTEVDYNYYYQTSGGTITNTGKTLATARRDLGWETHGGEGNPAFAGTGPTGYRLSESSPEIVKGLAQPNPGAGLFSFDKEGLERGTIGWSMGAYQYGIGQGILPLPPSNLKITN